MNKIAYYFVIIPVTSKYINMPGNYGKKILFAIHGYLYAQFKLQPWPIIFELIWMTLCDLDIYRWPRVACVGSFFIGDSDGDTAYIIRPYTYKFSFLIWSDMNDFMCTKNMYIYKWNIMYELCMLDTKTMCAKSFLFLFIFNNWRLLNNIPIKLYTIFQMF